MDINIHVLNTHSELGLEKQSIECPYCHQNQVPEMYAALRYKSSLNYFVLCECSNRDCQNAFNVLYNKNDEQFTMIEPSTQIAKEFSDIIKGVSPKFCDIYNEAYAAEQMGLGQITGVGYRKALEFLIKDYLISLDKNHEEEILKKRLGKCIESNVTDQKIKDVAKRAVWIGNDETHYIRIWEDKDISHLKALIDLCLYWIEAEIKTKKMLESMKYKSLLKLRSFYRFYVKARTRYRKVSKKIFMVKSRLSVKIKEWCINFWEYFKNNYCLFVFIIVCFVLFYFMNLTICKFNKEQLARANNDSISVVMNKNLVKNQQSQLQHLAFIDKTIRKSRKDSDLILKLNRIDERVSQLNKYLRK